MIILFYVLSKVSSVKIRLFEHIRNDILIQKRDTKKKDEHM